MNITGLPWNLVTSSVSPERAASSWLSGQEQEWVIHHTQIYTNGSLSWSIFKQECWLKKHVYTLWGYGTVKLNWDLTQNSRHTSSDAFSGKRFKSPTKLWAMRKSHRWCVVMMQRDLSTTHDPCYWDTNVPQTRRLKLLLKAVVVVERAVCCEWSVMETLSLHMIITVFCTPSSSHPVFICFFIMNSEPDVDSTDVSSHLEGEHQEKLSQRQISVT